MTTAVLSNDPSPRELLESGLSQLALTLTEDSKEKLLLYVALLEKWNKVYNLTAVHEPKRMIALHVLDSLSVLTRLQAHNRILDVGTGGGLPGIPLAIALAASVPETHITMLDANAKKTAFVRHVIGELELTNAEVVTHRVEQYQPHHRFGAVISRAFAHLRDFVESAGHLCAEDGRMLAMKGMHQRDEIAQIPDSFAIEEIVPLRVPQVEGQRHLVVIMKVKAKK